MARIPEAELDRLKQDISLIRLIESQGHTLTKRGKDWAMRCVFHEESTASLVVSEAKNLYHCFGCGAAGSVIDWVMKTQGVSLPHAVQILKSGATLDGGKVGTQRSHQRHLPSLAASAADADTDANAELLSVIDYYHATLKQSTEALAYLEARGLNHPALIDHFKLGYGNKTLTYRLPPGHTVAGKAMRARLQGAGVLRSTGHEHFNGCLVVPVIGLEGGANPGQSGQVLQLYGRRTQPNHKLPPEQSRHLYLPRPLAGVWNEAALVADKDIILCEALIDALTFWSAGYRNVIAAYGVNGFTVDHWQALKHHGTRRVLIAYDRDDAGNAAADKLAPELLEAGIECFRVLFPKGMDANDYARKVQPAEKSLGLALREAQWLGKGKRPGVVVAEPVERTAPTEVQSAAKEEAPAIEQAPTASSLAAPPQAEPAPLPVQAEAELPAEPHTEPLAEPTAKGELLLTLGERHWRIRGWQKNLAPEVMRVNAQVRREGERMEAAYYVDTLDVYSAKQRQAYIKQAAIELGVEEDTIKRDLGKVLLKLEALQDAAIREALAPKEATVKLSEADEAAALDLLKSPDLVARLVADMERCGIVGEATNLLAGYLAAVSRKLDAPLAVLIQSSSAAGKSSLMDAVLNLMPDEERIQYSAMTGQSLFYLGETDLAHKILAIAEEEGVRQAAYALKLLQSDGELTIASTGKDETTGNLVTKQYRVKGPVMLMLTTTAIDVDEELLNRCLVLTVNESREQTQAIHARQRAKQTLAGLLQDADRQAIVNLHQNAQRLLKPVQVVNPYADRLTFLDDKTRTRRDHMKYLTLIRAIALLHQHQRPIRRIEHRGQWLEYIEATQADIALANRIAHEVLGRTLDELPPQTRRLLTHLQGWVTARCAALDVTRDAIRFTRRDVREATGWGDTQLKLHLARLAEMEYLIAHGNGRRQAIDYELAYDGAGDDAPHLMGLIDPAELDNAAEWSGQDGERSGCGRGVDGLRSGCGRIEETQAQSGIPPDSRKTAPKARLQKSGSSLAAVVA